jgi:hypothetical protein
MANFFALSFTILVAPLPAYARVIALVKAPVISTAADEKREEQALASYNRINGMIRDGKRAEALTATEAAIKDYADCAEGLHMLRGAKIYLLAKDADKKEEAFKFAEAWLAATKRERKPLHDLRCRQLAQSLLNAAEASDPKDRDLRLVNLAIDLLHDTDENLHLYTQGRKESHVLGYRIHIRQLLAQGFSLRGENGIAVRQIEDAIAIQKKQYPAPGDDPKEFREREGVLRTALAKKLERYKQTAESEPKKK